MVTVTPLPITGYSACNALGNTPDAMLEALAAGRSGLGPSPIALDFDTTVGAVHGPFPELPPELAAWETRMARMAALLVAGLDPALERARARWRPARIAVLLGTSTAGAETTERAYRHYVEEGQLPDDYDFRRQHTYGAMLHVVGALAGAEGPALMVSTACTSSAKPLATAARLIETDVIDAAIVGGMDTLCAMTLRGFKSLGALSSEPCRPFSSERGGISIGEGGALLLVERSGEGVVLLEGVGESSDAYHISAPHPKGAGARAAMERAMVQAGCEPGDIDHVNAHGTGTRHNDVAEAAAIAGLLGPEVPVISTKGYTGHTLGGAGATEAVMGILAIEHGWIPPSVGAEPLAPDLGIRVVTERTDAKVRRVLSNSFAFGGNNVSVLLRAP